MERPPNATAAPTIICRRVGSLASIPRLLLSLIVTSWILNCGPPPGDADTRLVVSAFAKRVALASVHLSRFIAMIDSSCRKQNLQLDHGHSPSELTSLRVTGLLCM